MDGHLPNENSLVGNPETERAATTADGPGTGITGMFLSTHNFAYKFQIDYNNQVDYISTNATNPEKS